jgi:hypothetical protein
MSQVFNGNKMAAKRDIVIVTLVVITSISLGLLIAYAGS